MLICIDDIGLLPVTTETAEALYRVVDAAYEKRSIALSSNLHPAGFDELMPKTIANATVAPPRPCRHHHRQLDPPHPSNTRQRSEATGQLNPGQFHWPSVGNSDGHRWADPLTAYGQKLLAIDNAVVGRSIAMLGKRRRA